MAHKIIPTSKSRESLSQFIACQCRINKTILGLVSELKMDNCEKQTDIYNALDEEIQKQCSLEWDIE